MNNLKELITLFETKKNTHPNITHVWINYLKTVEIYNTISIKHAEKVFENLDNIDDYSQQQIQILQFLNNSNINTNI
jgi:hypothetical protein